MKGVLDRFEENQAVIVIEEEKIELIVPIEELPKGSKENTIFKIEKQLDEFKILSIDEEAEKAAKEKTSDLLAKLRAKSNGSKFKKN